MTNLQYNYVQINPETGEVLSCFTSSYEIPLPDYIEIPYATNDYAHKFYNASNGMFYWDAEFTQLWEECPSHNV